MNGTVATVGNVLVVVSAVLAVLVVVIYGRVPFWRTPTGLQLMVKAVEIAAVLVLAAVAVWYRNDTWFPVVRVVVFAPFPFVLAWQIWLILVAQARDARDASDSPES